jgi:hypothetical protein
MAQHYFLDFKDASDVYSIPSISNGYVEGTVKTPTSANKANQILFGNNEWHGADSTDYIILDCGDSDENI